jgi:acetoin utilization deacetylase AcuC-like enzyme
MIAKLEMTRRDALLHATLSPLWSGSARAGSLYVSIPQSVRHEPGAGAVDQPERLAAIEAALAPEPFSGLVRATAPAAPLEAILRVHSRTHLERLATAAPKQGVAWLDRDLAMSAGTYEAALHAAGGGILAVEAVMRGEAKNAFVAARPPGHHALPQAAMGFCFLNNAAIAARHAMAALGAERVAIVDFDLHHGNGLQQIFWDEKNVLYCSMHQSPLYPGTGAVNECGAFDNIVNAPLAKGDGGAAIQAALRERILPRLDAFRPDLILICAGFDAHLHDPLGGLRLVEQDFRDVTLRLLEVAARRCGGRVVSLLEGGYRPQDLAQSVAAHVGALIEA